MLGFFTTELRAAKNAYHSNSAVKAEIPRFAHLNPVAQQRQHP